MIALLKSRPGDAPRAAKPQPAARPPVGASIAALLVAALLAAPNAAAQPAPAPNGPDSGAGPTWLEPEAISGSSDKLDPALAVGANGKAVAVWHERQPDLTFVIFASIRRPGAVWTTPRQLSLSGGSTKDPAVALARNGDILAAWSRLSGGRWVVQAAFRPAGDLWLPPVNISPVAWDSASSSVAFAPSGEAMVVWSSSDSGGASPIGVEAATRGKDGAWSLPQYVSPAGEPAGRLRVGIADDGEATAIWGYPPSDEEWHLIRAASKRATESRWHATDTLSDSDEATEPDVAVSATGDVTAVWREAPAWNGGTGRTVRARTRPAGAPEWGPSEELSQLSAGPGGSPRACADAYDPQVTTGPAGHTVAIWACRTETESKAFVQSRERAPGDSQWRGTADISGPPTGTNPDKLKPRVEVNAEGGGVAAWRECPPGESCAVKAATGWAGGPWSAPIEISGGSGGEAPQLGVDASGNAAAAWDGGQVFVAGYDGSGPALRSLRIPESGVAHTELHFSVWPVDTWSRAAGVFWDFGDGDTARGRAVTHTYRRPGDYRVTVTAFDTLGQPSKTSETVRVLGQATPVPRIWP